MSESNKDKNINKEDNNSSSEKKSDNQKVKLSTEEKLKISEEKLLRSLAKLKPPNSNASFISFSNLLL